jgi:hypothetical protein
MGIKHYFQTQQVLVIQLLEYILQGKNTTGTGNAALGYAALRQNTTGNYNMAVGHNAGRFIAGGINR